MGQPAATPGSLQPEQEIKTFLTASAKGEHHENGSFPLRSKHNMDLHMFVVAKRKMGGEEVGHGEEVVSEVPNSLGSAHFSLVHCLDLSPSWLWDVCNNGNTGINNGGHLGSASGTFL